jgi:hypothetical protein
MGMLLAKKKTSRTHLRVKGKAFYLLRCSKHPPAASFWVLVMFYFIFHEQHSETCIKRHYPLLIKNPIQHGTNFELSKYILEKVK